MAAIWRLFIFWLSVSQVLSLRCLYCTGTSSSCRMVGRKCPSYETTCLSLAYRTTGGTNTVMKSCSTPELCNQTSIIDTGNNAIYITSTCCESDYCNINRYSTAQVFSNRLTCNTCTNSSVNCGTSKQQTPMFCDEVSNNCVDLVTTNFFRGLQFNTTYYKGCGSASLTNVKCSDLFAYDTGDYQRYSSLSCCNSNNQCNSGQKSISILKNNNGVSCYGCMETGKNECAVANQTTVRCTGTLLRCMEAFDRNRNTVMKGCSTVGFCSSTKPWLDVPNISEIECCAGSYCNNFTRQTAVPAAPATSAVGINTDFRLLVLFICLIYVAVSHVS